MTIGPPSQPQSAYAKHWDTRIPDPEGMCPNHPTGDMLPSLKLTPPPDELPATPNTDDSEGDPHTTPAGQLQLLLPGGITPRYAEGTYPGCFDAQDDDPYNRKRG